MGLETGTTIEDLNTNWPLGSDPKNQGDDHLRLVKTCVNGSNEERKTEIADVNARVDTVEADLADPSDGYDYARRGDAWVRAYDPSSKTASFNHEVTQNNNAYLIVGEDNNVVVTIDEGHANGHQFVVHFFGTGASDVTINASGAESIVSKNGAGSVVLDEFGTAAHFLFSGAVWYCTV